MPERSAKVEETSLRLDANLLIEELKPDPSQVRRWFSSNVLQQALAHVVGWTGTKPVLVKASDAGYLYVASVGVPYQHAKVYSGNAPDMYGTDMVFPQVVSRLDIFVWDYALIFKRAAPDSLFEEEIEIPANSVYSVDVTTQKVNVKNKTAGQVARYQIVGWY